MDLSLKTLGYLGDKPGVNPVLEVPNKKPVITQRTPGTDSSFELADLEKIYRASRELEEQYPFQVQLIQTGNVYWQKKTRANENPRTIY